MPQIYTTKEIAGLVGIHVNTVRFYEQMGFLTPPVRRPNGYRAYTGLQLAQCRLVRLAMRAEVLQSGLRKKAVEILRLCAAQEFEKAFDAAVEYSRMIEWEISAARAAIASVERMMAATPPPGGPMLKRREAAQALGLTAETLRTWERSGLIDIDRWENGYRAYTVDDMERLNIIRVLRCAGYSLSAILRLMSGREGAARSVEEILNTPGENEEIVSACDRLIISLQNTARDAADIQSMLREIEELATRSAPENFLTPQ